MRLLAITLLCCVICACNKPVPEYRAVYVLIDRSGIYSDSFDNISKTLKLLLATLSSGDSLALARIDNEIFSHANVMATLTLSSRPSYANNQKRALYYAVDKMATEKYVGSYTDVTGGMLEAAAWLNATRAGKKIIIVFSDFPEEPRTGYMNEFPVNYNGASVLVWNVLEPPAPGDIDLAESHSFVDRAAVWQQRVTEGGGQWIIIHDVAKLAQVIQ